MSEQLILIAAGVVIGMIGAGVPAIIFARQRNQAFQKVVDAYAKMVEKGDERFVSVMDRLHATKNLPPSDINMAALYQERHQEDRERRIERRNGGPLSAPSKIGLVDQALDQMARGIADGKYSSE